MLPKPITADDFENMQEPDFVPGTNGFTRKRGRQSRETGAPAAMPREAKPKSSPTILLTAERVSKIWTIMTGGRLVIETDPDHGGIICHVSRDSFDSLLEGMIDRL